MPTARGTQAMQATSPRRRLLRGIWLHAVLLGALTVSCSRGPAPTGTDLPTPVPFTPLAQIPTWTAPPSAVVGASATPPLVPRPYDWSLGPQQASVILVEYADFQSEACARLASVLAQIRQAHEADIRLIFRPYPLIPLHDKASLAAQAAHAAGVQGSFWVMHDLLFDRQQEWQALSIEEFHAWLLRAAGEGGLDAHALDRDLTNARYEALINQAFLDAYSSGIPGTPVLYFNGELFAADLSAASLEAAVRLVLLQQRQFAAYPEPVIQPDAHYVVRLVFDAGEMLAELYPESAPLAVNSFVFLAQQGWYDNTPVHRVLPGVLVEMGDPTGTGLGGPGYFFRTEVDPTLTFEQAGVLALSSVGPDTNGSQFFVTLKPLPELNGSRTILGRVLAGLGWASRLPARDPMQDLLTPPAATLQRVIIEMQ